MDSLASTRVRHSMLLSMYVPMKNYLECLERGYLGNIEEFEKPLVAELKKNCSSIEKVLWDYFDKEGNILNG